MSNAIQHSQLSSNPNVRSSSSMQRLIATHVSPPSSFPSHSFFSSNDVQVVPCVHFLATAVIAPDADHHTSFSISSPLTSPAELCCSSRIYGARLCRSEGFSICPRIPTACIAFELSPMYLAHYALTSECVSTRRQNPWTPSFQPALVLRNCGGARGIVWRDFFVTQLALMLS